MNETSRRKYEHLDVEVIRFESDDVITASKNNPVETPPTPLGEASQIF